MTNEEPAKAPVQTQTIDLQGVASFASLVEMLAQELGTSAGKMQGSLPNGPTFNQLIGEIDLNGQGYVRKLTLLAQPGSPLTLRLQSAWGQGRPADQPVAIVGGVTADYYLGATVEQIIPQGRALARYIEDIMATLDRMVSLGQSNKLASMQISAAELQAFEAKEGEMIRPSTPKPTASVPYIN
jgi:hypothetical protein